MILGLVRREKPTLRQLLASLAGARGHFTFAGTPEQVADVIEEPPPASEAQRTRVTVNIFDQHGRLEPSTIDGCS